MATSTMGKIDLKFSLMIAGTNLNTLHCLKQTIDKLKKLDIPLKCMNCRIETKTVLQISLKHYYAAKQCSFKKKTVQNTAAKTEHTRLITFSSNNP